MIGHELGGRYEIIERIGGGGMALVYKAHDILLGRNVAIKVLRQQFVHDEEFIRRFRREAQSAASLSHPNVVSIYDVGQEDEIHYIVMEYIEGYNLNEIIKERAPLQVEEAVRIASQICDALDHAHHNQIIHRDIKPHNILIGRNGRVKVTDFGIARAVTSTTITQTGSVIGSVHYFSPEHAKGVSTGEKSDLYSLGIVLYQMLTAKLPFLGESPISVALKHLQEDFDDPRDTNPLIPQSVENVILRSMRKNPQERYQSAKEMLQDLETCLLPERRNEPRIQFADADADQTRAMPAIKAVSKGAVSSKRNNKALFDEEDEDEKPVNGKQSNKKWVKPTLWISLTLFILICMVGVIWYVKAMLVVQDVKIPNVITKQEDVAVKELTALGLVIEDPIIRTYKEGFDEGVVFDQSKKEGAVVKEGASIQLSVSIKKPLPIMPELKGKTFEEASKLLIEKGVKEGNITKKDEYSDQPSGVVIGQDLEAGSEFDASTVEIVLTVSQGEESFMMPDLVNKTQKEAESIIKQAGLKLGTVEESSSFIYEKGEVIKQWPFEPNTSVSVDSEVNITVSTGYPPEALNYTFNVPVAPVEDGKNSKIRIEYSDARNEDGEKKDWGTKTIKSTQVFSIDLVLAPNKNAYVTIFRDGELFDTYPISYSDAKNGSVPEVVIPQTDPVLPTDETDVEPQPDPNADPNADPGDEEVVDPTAMNSPGKNKGKHKSDNRNNSNDIKVTSGKP